MKKYIIIAGVPRAGKSTLTSIISKQLGYQHICFDTINYALEQNCRYARSYFRNIRK